MQSRAFNALVIALLAALLGVFLVLPLLESVRGAVIDRDGNWTAGYLLSVFSNPIYMEGLWNALGIAFFSTALAALAGILLAVVLDRYDFPGKRLLSVLLPFPLIVPPFVGAVGIKQLLGQSGALNAFLIKLGVVDSSAPIDWLRDGRFAAVVLLTALHLYPIVYFNVSAALASFNIDLEEAAQSLGASRLRAFRKITLPTIGPSVLASTSIVFIWALTELGVPLMCDYTRVTSVQIFSGLKDISQNPSVYGLVVVLLGTVLTLYGLSALLAFGKTTPLATKGVRLRRPERLSSGRALLLSAAVGGFLLLAAAPNAGVLLVAVAGDWYGTVLPSSYTLQHFRAALGHDLVVPSILNSLRYVLLSTTCDLLLGTAIAWVLVRARGTAVRVLDLAVMLPLAVPGLVMAFGYLAVSREGRPLAALNPVADPTVLLVVAYSIRRLPFVVRSAAAGLTQVSTALEEAAQNLGAGRLKTFWRVTLPLFAPHLLAGGVFAFALSLLEVSDSLILAQRQATFPITKAIFELFQMLGNGRQVAAALGVWAMVFLASAIALTRALLGRGLGTIFRL
ncbi:MAG TPA: iron ABC transporter permease [Polyangiaceae bacterium]|nr:iron ABC transporter permease [Polyangiaceae bacterium]